MKINLRIVLGFVMLMLAVGFLVSCQGAEDAALGAPKNRPRAAGSEQSTSVGFATDRNNKSLVMGVEQGDTDHYWVSAKELIYKRVPALIAQDQDELKRGIKRNKLMRGDPAKRQIALTFDDGPHPDYTPKILDILKQNKIKATFFVIGMMCEKYPDLVKAELAAGHCIGNHTYHHVNITKIPIGYVATEIKACGEVVKNITGKPMHLCRPPGGDYNDKVAQVCEALGYTVVLWTDDPGDYKDPGGKVLMERLTSRVGNGGIILVHDGVQETLDILPKFIQTMKKKGYEFVTIDQMLGRKS